MLMQAREQVIQYYKAKHEAKPCDPMSYPLLRPDFDSPAPTVGSSVLTPEEKQLADDLERMYDLGLAEGRAEHFLVPVDIPTSAWAWLPVLACVGVLIWRAW